MRAPIKQAAGQVRRCAQLPVAPPPIQRQPGIDHGLVQLPRIHVEPMARPQQRARAQGSRHQHTFTAEAGADLGEGRGLPPITRIEYEAEKTRFSGRGIGVRVVPRTCEPGHLDIDRPGLRCRGATQGLQPARCQFPGQG